MERKFAALRVIAALYKIAGLLVAIGTVLAVISIVGGALREYGFDRGSAVASIGVIFTSIAGGLLALGLFAIGDGLYLMIAIEANTRLTTILLRERAKPLPQHPQPIQPLMPQPIAPPPSSYPPAV